MLKDLQERSPGVDEFEQTIISYQSLSDEINTEPEYLLVGVIAVYTGKKYYFLYNGSVFYCQFVKTTKPQSSL